MHEFIENGLQTISRCNEAGSLLYAIDQKMYNDVFADEQLVYSGFSHTLNCEDSLLSLTASGEVDGVFYANVLKMELKDSLVTYVCRVFEYGCFNGFGQTCVDKMKCQLNVENMIPIHVFNLLDVENDKARNSLLARKKGNFSQ